MNYMYYFGGVIWRAQMLLSLALLLVFPLAAILLVNGALFWTSQGAELIQDLWAGYPIQDRVSIFNIRGWSYLYISTIVLVFGLSIWSTTCLLCEPNHRKTWIGFARIRTNSSEAIFLRKNAPFALPLFAAAPLTFVIVIYSVERMGFSGGDSHPLIMARISHLMLWLGGVALIGYLFLFSLCARFFSFISKRAGRLVNSRLRENVYRLIFNLQHRSSTHARGSAGHFNITGP